MSKEKLLIFQDKSSVVPGEMFAENKRPAEKLEIGTLRLLCWSNEAELQEKAVFKFRSVASLQYFTATVRASVLWEAIKNTFCIILQSLHN